MSTINMNLSNEEIIELLKEYTKYNPKYITITNLNPLDVERNKEILSLINQYNKNNSKIVITKNSEKKLEKNSHSKYIYSKEETKCLNELNNYLIKISNSSLYYNEEIELSNTDKIFIEDENLWSHDKVIKANSKIDEIVANIKKSQLTPYEAMIYIHELATSFKYNMEKPNQNRQLSRNIVNILTKDNPEIVCVGYGEFVKAIIDKLDMPGLKCDFDECRFIDYENLNSLGFHLKNFVMIDDEKYDIHGVYNEDATYDSKNEENLSGFSHLLYPIEDLQRRKDSIIVHMGFIEKNEGYYDFDTEEMSTINSLNNKIDELCIKVSLFEYINEFIHSNYSKEEVLKTFEDNFIKNCAEIKKEGNIEEINEMIDFYKVSFKFINENYENYINNPSKVNEDEKKYREEAELEINKKNSFIKNLFDDSPIKSQINNIKDYYGVAYNCDNQITFEKFETAYHRLYDKLNEPINEKEFLKRVYFSCEIAERELSDNSTNFFLNPKLKENINKRIEMLEKNSIKR